MKLNYSSWLPYHSQSTRTRRNYVTTSGQGQGVNSERCQKLIHLLLLNFLNYIVFRPQTCICFRGMSPLCNNTSPRVYLAPTQRCMRVRNNIACINFDLLDKVVQRTFGAPYLVHWYSRFQTKQR